MRISSRSLFSSTITIGLVSTVVAITIVLFTANVTSINAQQLTNQPAASLSERRSFESTQDSFRLLVPEGWIIRNMNNTGSVLAQESTQGYGILAQLCPQEQQLTAPSNAGGNRGDTFSSCDQSENDIIHIVRYPDLDNRLQGGNNNSTTNNTTTTSNTAATTTAAITSNSDDNNNIITTNDNNVLLYHMQKLQQVGYRDIEIINSTDRLVNVLDPQTNQTIQSVPAKFVEMTYSTASAPNEPRSGYLISTATNATAPGVGMTKGYTVFYEGSSVSAAELALGFGSLRELPPAVKQIFDSFELTAAPEVAEQALAEQTASIEESSPIQDGGNLVVQTSENVGEDGEGEDDDDDDDAGDEDEGDDDGDGDVAEGGE